MHIRGRKALVCSLIKSCSRASRSDLDRLVDLIIHACPRGAGPDRIFEGKRRGVSDLADQAHRVLEIRVRFAGKADDEIT
jgi:hypothetical protein